MEQSTSRTPHDKSKLAQRNVLLVGLAGLGVAAVFYFFDPAEGGPFYGCPFYKRTGLLCAGCGGQRALHALLHGHLLEALAMNLVAVLAVAPMVLYGYTSWVLHAFTGRRLPFPKITLFQALFSVFLLILYAILRNFPMFSFLTPPT